MNIVCAWESPTNEGTYCYRKGNRSCGSTWTTGHIEWKYDRILVYDADGHLRVSLPARSTAVEWGEDEKI